METNELLLLKYGKLLRKPTGDVLFQAGDEGNSMYMILSGTVEIILEQDGRRMTVALLGAGDMLGEMSLLEGLPRSGTAVTASACELVELDEQGLQGWINEEPAVAWRLLKGLSTRVRTLNQELAKRIGSDLQDASQVLHAHARGITASIRQIAGSAEDIRANERKLATQIKEVERISRDISKMLSFIQRIAGQTQILGLNAAIEAARSGEFGRGFGVIAEEIRKLSVQSKEQAGRIADLTQQIGNKMADVTAASEQSAAMSEEQAGATQQMVAAIEDVSALAERLASLAESLH